MNKADKKLMARKAIKTVTLGDRVQVNFGDKYEHNHRTGRVVDIMYLMPGRPQLYAVQLDSLTTVDCPPWAVQKTVAYSG